MMTFPRTNLRFSDLALAACLILIPALGQAHLVTGAQTEGEIVEPSAFKLRLGDGARALQAARMDEAEQAFVEANRLDPKAYEPMIGLASVAQSRARLQTAREWMASAVTASQWEPRVLQAQARLLIDQNMSKQAVDSYRKAMTVNPGNIKLRLDLADLFVGPLKRPADAVALMRETVAEKPDAAAAHVKLGEALIADGQNDAAIRVFEDATRRDSSNYQAAHALGTNSLKQGKPLQALGYFDRALIARPDWSPALIGRGNALSALNRGDEAVSAYRRAAELSPQSAMPHLLLAQLFAEMKRPDDQEGAYRDALAVDGSRADIMNNLADLLASRRQKLDEALTLIRRAVEIEPRRANYQDTLGLVMLARGDSPGGRLAFEKALAMEPNNAEFRSHLAQLGTAAASPPRPAATVASGPVQIVPVAPVAGNTPSVTRPITVKGSAEDPAQTLGPQLESWRKAWEAKDVAAYLSFYGKAFVPADNRARPAWEAERRTRLGKPGEIEVRILNPVFMRTGDAITVVFEQRYKSAGFGDVVRKEIEWRLEADAWRIRREGIK